MIVLKIKKSKRNKKCVIKRKLQLEDQKNCLEAAQTEFKISHLEKNKIDVNSLAKLIKNNKSILKTQQRFTSKKRNVFTEKINKIALNSNDDKRMQSFDSIETYAHGTSKDLVRKKEQIKCNNIIKQYKNV